jgi:hypothetical protein
VENAQFRGSGTGKGTTSVVPKEGKRVEQAFQACVKDHQKITGLQPPRYVLDSN